MDPPTFVSLCSSLHSTSSPRKKTNTARLLLSQISSLSAEALSLFQGNSRLEAELAKEDVKISLLIKNRIRLEDALAVRAGGGGEGEGGGSNSSSSSSSGGRGPLESSKMRTAYGELFFLLQRRPVYLSRLIRDTPISQIDQLLHVIMFNIYSPWEPIEENLLLSLFRLVLAAEIEGAPQFGSLLRSNTPITRCMTMYTKRALGRVYVTETLQEVVRGVVSEVGQSGEVRGEGGR